MFFVCSLQILTSAPLREHVTTSASIPGKLDCVCHKGYILYGFTHCGGEFTMSEPANGSHSFKYEKSHSDMQLTSVFDRY